jgi:hypothetical protein
MFCRFLSYDLNQSTIFEFETRVATMMGSELYCVFLSMYDVTDPYSAGFTSRVQNGLRDYDLSFSFGFHPQAYFSCEF